MLKIMPLIAKNENNAENAQQKADGWPGRWNFFEPEFLGIGGETRSGVHLSPYFLQLWIQPNFSYISYI